MATTNGEPVRVECWCRSLATTPTGPQADVVERLEWLVADGAIDDLQVETWPAVVPADRAWALGEHERRVRDRLDAFERWTDRAGVRLGAGFGDRRVGSVYADTSVGSVRILPVVTLAEYRDGDLVAVSPMVDEDGRLQVRDHLDALSRGHPPRRESPLATSG